MNHGSPGFAVRVFSPWGELLDEVRARNLVTDEGAIQLHEGGFEGAFDYCGLFIAGEILESSTAAAMGVTEFLDYTSNSGFSDRILLGPGSTVIDTGAETATFKLSTDLTGPAIVKGAGRIIGAFITANPDFAPPAGERLWAGAFLPRPVLVGPNSRVTVHYTFTISL
jgi:hypothetical protein